MDEWRSGLPKLTLWRELALRLMGFVALNWGLLRWQVQRLEFHHGAGKQRRNGDQNGRGLRGADFGFVTHF